MVDTLTPEQRSKRMSLIRSKDTSPELALRKALHALGLRYRVGNKHLPGKPDIVFPKQKLAVFVHGCFWHRHKGCKVANTPKSNTAFWLEKFDRNVARDERSEAALKTLGWNVEIVWECELAPKRLASAAARIAAAARH